MFDGFSKGPDYEDVVTRQQFCEESHEWITAQDNNCVKSLKMEKADVFTFITSKALQKEAKKWFRTTFSTNEKFNIMDWDDFVSRFKRRYCEIPERLQQQVSTLETQKSLAESRQTVTALVSRIENLEAALSHIQRTASDPKDVIHELQWEVWAQKELTQRVEQHNKLNSQDTVKPMQHKQQAINVQQREVKEATSSLKATSHVQELKAIQDSHQEFEQQFTQHATLLESLSTELKQVSSSLSSITADNQKVKEITAMRSSKPEPAFQPGISSCGRCGIKSPNHLEQHCASRHRRCYKCNLVGHFARACRTAPQCQRCGYTNHREAECGILKKGTLCWFCHCPGHLYRMCKFRYKHINIY